MSFEDWQKQNQQIGTGFEAWQVENEMTGISLPTGGGLEEFGKGLVDTFLTGAKGALGTLEFATPMIKKTGLGLPMRIVEKIKGQSYEELLQEELTPVKEKIESAREPFEMTHRGVSAQAGRILGNAVGYMGQALAGGYTGGPVGAALVGFGLEGQNAYDNAIEKGATEEQAQMERLLVGSINAAIEALQVGKVMKFAETGKHSIKAFVQAVRTKSYKQMGQLGKEFGADILRHAIEEGLEEFVQEGVSMVVPAALRGDYPMKPDGSPDVWAIGEQLGTAAIGGAFAGSVLGAGGGMIQADVLAPSRKKLETIAQRIRESDISDRAKARMIKHLEQLLPEQEKIQRRFERLEPEKHKHYADLIEGMQDDKVVSFLLYKYPKLFDLVDKIKFSSKISASGSWNPKTKTLIINPIRNQTPIKTARTLIHELIHAHQTYRGKLEPAWDEIYTKYNLQDKSPKEVIEFLRTLSSEEYKQLPTEEKPYKLESLIAKKLLKDDLKVPDIVKDPLQIPESTRKVLDLADNVAETLKDLQAERKEFKEHIKEGRAKRFGKQVKILEEMQADDPIVAKQVAQATAKGELRKDYPDVAEKFSRENWQTLVQSINNATDISQGERMELWECLDDLFLKQKPPSESRIKAFDKFFGTDIYQSTKGLPKTKVETTLHKIADIMNVPKAVLASFDVSMPLRQAWHYTMAHPIKSMPSWGKMLRAFVSGKYSDFVAMEMQTNPMFKTFTDAGLEFTKPGSRTEGEEYFQGELAHRIPGIGKIVKASERAAVTYMNAIRMQAANHFYESMGSPDVDTKAFQDMIDFVNHSTSRGGFKGRAGKWFKKWSPELGAVLWTPKMIIGKTQALADLRKPEIRKLVACETVRAFGGATLAAMLLALGFGGRFGKDPRSSDFGKVIIGKTRLDLYGTYLPMFRVISQMATGERKAATTGRLSDVERKEVVTRFLRSKLNPTAGVGWDIWTGQTFLGKKMKYEGDFVAEYIYEHITPLFLQDLADAVKYQGFDTLTFVAPLAVHGAGAATYEPTPRGDEVELKNHYAQQTYGTSWDEIGPAAQKVLRVFRPEIVKAEEETKRTREDYTFIGKLAQEEQEVGNRVQKKLSKSVQKEMDRLAVDIGGLRRQLKRDWYLNKKRYNQYQQELKVILDKSISNLISNPSWYRLNDGIQEVMLKTTIDQCKKLVRQRIINQANLKDLEQMKR